MSFRKTNEVVKRNSGRVGNIRYYVKAEAIHCSRAKGSIL